MSHLDVGSRWGAAGRRSRRTRCWPGDADGRAREAGLASQLPVRVPCVSDDTIIRYFGNHFLNALYAAPAASDA
eukprot:4967179-Prymnesium_polylepis.2